MKFLVLFVFSVLLCDVHAQEDCTTPNQEAGECTSLKNCPTLLDYLKRHPLTSYNSESAIYFKKVICGFEGRDPKVCCPINNGVSSLPTVVVTTRPPTPKPKNSVEVSVNTNLLPGLDECGTGSDYRLYGGVATELDEFPWMALIEYQKTNSRGFHCGGVLISKRYVLTAAHCVKGKTIPRNWKIISVRLGEYDTEKDPDCDKYYCAESAVNVPVSEKITHEQYDPYDNSQHHDIALLRLIREVAFTDYIKPICVPTSSQLLRSSFANSNMTVCGWGSTESGSESNIKLKLHLPVKSHSECVSVYRPAGIDFINGQMCAGGIEGKDSCKGDSGGPLMTFHQFNANANWFVMGVVSLGPSRCGLKDWPGIYTRVTEYVPWLVGKLKP